MWLKENWKQDMIKYKTDVLLYNPDTVGSNPSWQNFNAKRIDIVVETETQLLIIETDPTPFTSSLGQLLVYLYYFTDQENEYFNLLPSDMSDKYYNPSLYPLEKEINILLFVRETDHMIEKVCNFYGIQVIEIPLGTKTKQKNYSEKVKVWNFQKI